jgi:single stranded DNA-binding protein
MQGVNKVILLGNVGCEPELGYTTRQHPICTFSLATHRYIVNAEGGRETKTDWHKIVLFGRMAEFFAGALKKGSKIYLEGVLEYHDVPHGIYKDVVLHKTDIEARRFEVIDDFPPLNYGRKNRHSTAGQAHTVDTKRDTARQAAKSKGDTPKPGALKQSRPNHTPYSDDLFDEQ